MSTEKVLRGLVGFGVFAVVGFAISLSFTLPMPIRVGLAVAAALIWDRFTFDTWFWDDPEADDDVA